MEAGGLYSVSVRVGLSITSVCTRSDKIPFLEHTCGRFTRLSGQRQWSDTEICRLVGHVHQPMSNGGTAGDYVRKMFPK
jgi:hypothetical protein